MALQIMMVALGCALGGVARFLLGKGVNAQPWVSDGFPWATLIITSPRWIKLKNKSKAIV